MYAWIWRILALSLIISGSISVVHCMVTMDTLRALMSGIIVLLLGFLIVLFEKEKRYLAFFITGIFLIIKLLYEVLSNSTFETYMWVDVLGIVAMCGIGLFLKRQQ